MLDQAAHRHLTPMLMGTTGEQTTPARDKPRTTRGRSNSEGSWAPAKTQGGWVSICVLEQSGWNAEGTIDSTVDNVDLRQASCFAACSEPLAAMQLSPSGMKLACAPASGQVILVYALLHAPDLVEYDVARWSSQTKRLQPALLCKLVRGYTPSLVVSLGFSADEDRVCAVSSHGTGHIFDMGSCQNRRAQQPADQNSRSASMSLDKLLSTRTDRATGTGWDCPSLFRIRFARRSPSVEGPQHTNNIEDNASDSISYEVSLFQRPYRHESPILISEFRRLQRHQYRMNESTQMKLPRYNMFSALSERDRDRAPVFTILCYACVVLFHRFRGAWNSLGSRTCWRVQRRVYSRCMSSATARCPTVAFHSQ